MKTHQQMLREFLKNPVNRKAYDDLEVEFKIHNALVKARIQNKFTQKQLAQKLGVSQVSLERFRNGEMESTLSFLQKVTSGLGLKLTIL